MPEIHIIFTIIILKHCILSKKIIIFAAKFIEMIINNRIIPFGTYIAINIFGVIFTKTKLTDEMIRHEKIHTRQQIELLFVFFYVWYVIEWLIKLAYYRNQYKAYSSISFEREAYAKQQNRNYLMQRKHFAWIKFLKNS